LLLSAVPLRRRRCWAPAVQQSINISRLHGRLHIAANGVSCPPGKMDEKSKSENMQKRAVFYVYVIF